jgi:hypothetical protein
MHRCSEIGRNDREAPPLPLHISWLSAFACSPLELSKAGPSQITVKRRNFVFAPATVHWNRRADLVLCAWLHFKKICPLHLVRPSASTFEQRIPKVISATALKHDYRPPCATWEMQSHSLQGWPSRLETAKIDRWESTLKVTSLCKLEI